jgi:hypothetical protein
MTLKHSMFVVRSMMVRGVASADAVPPLVVLVPGGDQIGIVCAFFLSLSLSLSLSPLIHWLYVF